MSKRIYSRVISIMLVITTLFSQYGTVAYAFETDDAETADGSEETSDYQYESDTESEQEVDNAEDTKEVISAASKEDAKIVSEIVDARDEFSKQYLMSDNSKSVVLYSEPVHYLTEDGVYAEIDNSVQKTEEGYENVDNTYSVVFTDNEESRGEVKFEEDEYQISWQYMDEPEISQDIEVLNDAGVISDNTESAYNALQEVESETTELDVSVKNEKSDYGAEEEIGHVINSSTVSYDGYGRGVKLEYSPTGFGVKENIILSGKESGNVFSFKIKLSGLKARVNSANEVELFDEASDEVKYYFPAPFMTDADSKESYDVWYSLSDTEPEKGEYSAKKKNEDSIIVQEEEILEASEEASGESELIIEDIEENARQDEETTLSDEEVCIDGNEIINFTDSTKEDNVIQDVVSSDDGYIFLTLTADEEWLENAEYPVTIDPFVVKAGNDLSIDCESINSLNAQNSSLYVGCENVIDNNGKKTAIQYRSYIKFELPYIEKGSIITDAQLYLSGTEIGSNKHYLTARKVTTYWSYKNGNESSGINSWSDCQAPGFTDERIIDYAVNGGYFDITRAVRDWYASPDENYGLEFRAYDETCIKKDSISLSKNKNRPYLKVTFRNYVGLENYWATHSTSVGTAGMGYINDYTGALTVVNTDVSTNGLRMPFNIQHVYNSNTEEGWKLSYDQRIEVPANELDVKTYPYVYIDEDGTKHYFKAKDVTYQENGKKKTASKNPTTSVGYPAAEDEDGLKLFIVPVTDKELKYKYPLKLLDKSGSTVKYFDLAGRLAMISDSNQFENASNSLKKSRNRIAITQEKYGEIRSLEKYNEVIAALDGMYNYTLLSMASLSDERECKENMIKAKTILTDLTGDVYARTDYKIAKDVQLARDTIEALCSTDKLTVEKIKKDSLAAKKSMNSALAQADSLNLMDERIVAVADAVDNTSIISYVDGRISSISDPTKADHDAVNSYEYEDGRLIRIAFSNGKNASYTYDENGNLDCMQDNSGYKVEFIYDKNRVVDVQESVGDSNGQRYTIKYNDDNTTSFRFSGIDDVYGEYKGKIDDVINTYVFDEKGRVISAYSTNLDDTNGDGIADRKIEVYGANACTYEDTAAKQVARTSYDDQSPESHPNLLKDPGFEKGFEEWKLYEPDIPKEFRKPIGSAVTPDDADASYLGSKHLLLAAEGDEYALVEQKLELEEGDYVISYRFKAVRQEEKGVLCPTVRDEDMDFPELQYDKYKCDDDKWIILTYKFSIKVKANYYIGFYAQNATARFDCAHLETGSVAHNYSTTEVVSASANADKKEDDPSVRNKIKDCAVTGRQTQNLLKDHSFENKDAVWNIYKDTSVDDANAIAIRNANKIEVKTESYEKFSYLGNKALLCKMKSVKRGNAGASQSVMIPNTGRYTLSAYVKAYGISETNAYLKVNGPDDTYYSEKLTSSTLTQFGEGWDRLKVSFDAKAGDVYTIAAEVEVTGDSAKGYVSFDCIQLEKSEVANEYNALEDSDFEASQGGLPFTWSNLKNVEYQDEPASGIDGGKCYHITGEPGKDKYLKCNVELGDNTNSYVLSGWIKTKTTPIRKGRELRVRAYHVGETEKLESSLKFNDYSDGWRYFTLLMPAHKWKKTTISFDFYDNIGDLYIDNLQLSKNDICTKTFDSNGRVTGVAASQKQTTYEYDSFGRMEKMVTPGGVTQTFSYDDSNKNTKITSTVGPNSYMTYDKYGNQTSMSAHKPVTSDENGNPIKQLELYTENTYSSNGNYLKTSTDANSAVTEYDFQENTGLLLAEMGPRYNIVDLEAMSQGFWGQVKAWSTNTFGGQEGIRFDYGYDSLERIKEVKCGLVNGKSRTVSYTYDDEDEESGGSGFGDLIAINHNGFSYKYVYDEFGNVLETKINNDALSTNEYNDFNGSLKKTTYADGTSKSVDYDPYGNVIGEVTKLNGQNENEKGTTTDYYVYYNDGKLAVHTDNIVITDSEGNFVEKNGLKTEYDYSETGKVSRSTVTGKVSGVDQYSRLQYTYNTQGKVQELSYEVAEGNEKKLRTYKYKSAKDGLSEKDTLPDGSTKEYKYDSLRRSTNVIYSPKSSASGESKLYTSAAYELVESKSKNLIGTTNSIRNYVNKIGTNGKKTENTYEYKCDARGNICGIDEFSVLPDKNGKKHAANTEDYERIYQYDAFGEVVRAREVFGSGESLEYSYSYDDGGNITEEGILDLKNKDKKTNIKTHSYRYDTEWRDKLIAYNDGSGEKTITYDPCGNPTSYLGMEMRWNAVDNSLATVKDGNKVYTYSYLSDGQRVSKTVDDKTTVYIYNAGMLLAEDNPEYRINYYYDASGVATEIGYIKKDNGKYVKEEYFFFTRNGQGDIVGIYRSSDSKRMGTYEYDLWGNPVTINATADDTNGITDKNPLRYRGYYYDRETKFYYLNARYYDPKVHRFISADSVIAGVSSDVIGYNLFAYCDNDPVNKIDTTGNWPTLTNKQKIAIGIAVIAVAAVLTVATCGAGTATLAAAVHCFAVGALEGSIVGAATGAASGAAINGGIAYITSGGDLEKTKQAAIDGACDGFMTGSITGFVTGGMTSNHCFVAGTLVETIDGPIPIEQIEEGEFVLSEDPKTGDVTYKRVLETYINETTELIHLNIDGEEIVTTPAHPFYVKNIGFVLAGDLEEGTTLVDNEGNELHLLIKRWEQLQNAVLVYNVAVEDYHTYFVGTTNVLVHNNCGAENIKLDKAKGYKTFKTLKKHLGSPGEGNEWHHIVEQCQVNKSGFAKELINNPENMIKLTVEEHRKVSAFYSSLYKDTGMTFRNFLAGKDIVTQYKEGLRVLKMLGVSIS